MFDISVSSFDADSEVTYIFIMMLVREYRLNEMSGARANLNSRQNYLLTDFVTFELQKIYFPNF